MITAAASPAASHASPFAAVCGHIVSGGPFLEHGKLPPQTFDYTAPPPTSIMLAVYELLPACRDESAGTEAMERTGHDNEMK